MTSAEDLPHLSRPIIEPKTPLLAEDLPKLELIHRIETSLSPEVTKAMLTHPLVEIARRMMVPKRAKWLRRGPVAFLNPVRSVA
jgi:hypothetical protein